MEAGNEDNQNYAYCFIETLKTVLTVIKSNTNIIFLSCYKYHPVLLRIVRLLSWTTFPEFLFG